MPAQNANLMSPAEICANRIRIGRTELFGGRPNLEIGQLLEEK